MYFSAVEHRSTDNFCYPLSESELAIGIKTGCDIKRVFIIYGDPFDGTVTETGWKWNVRRIEMTEQKELSHSLWRSITVRLSYSRCKYYFELHEDDGNGIWYYLEDGFHTAEDLTALHEITGNTPGFIFPWLNAAECIRPPDWVSRTVWYQIFPDRFCRDKTSQNPAALPWAAPDCTVGNHERYGGTLRGITEKLDYLEALHITGLYLNPINAAPSVHKYDTTDYLKIDPAFGTAADLCMLVREAHARGIKVMLDGVFNHCGWDFAPWQEVVRNGKDSPYFDWFIVKKWPIETVAESCTAAGTETADNGFSDNKTGFAEPIGMRLRPSGANGKHGHYMTFAYVDDMPKLNTNNPDVIAYLLDICETWVRTFDIDALRLDVANELSHTFCRQLNRRMRSLKKDFYILGEIWHNALPWLRGDEFDSVMNYPLARSIWKFFHNKTLPAHFLECELNAVFTQYPAPVNSGLFNLLDSHDTMRLITRSSGNADTVWQQYALLFMLPGSPCIYYGSEVLLAGGEDPDNRRCMPWKEIEAGVYADSLAIMRQLLELRRTHPAMTASDYSYLYGLHPVDDEPNRIIHLQKRFTPIDSATASSRRIDLILNCGASPVSIAHIIDGKTHVFISQHCRENILHPDGFIFFERYAMNAIP